MDRADGVDRATLKLQIYDVLPFSQLAMDYDTVFNSQKKGDENNFRKL